MLSNILTAVGIAACVCVAMIEPSRGTLLGFMALLYCMVPFTVLSQLTTAPLLGRLAPMNRRGYLQGINVTVMSASNSIAPWLLGLLSDQVGTFETLFLTVAFSLLAAVVNMFLYHFAVLSDVYGTLLDGDQWRIQSNLESIEIHLS